MRISCACCVLAKTDLQLFLRASPTSTHVTIHHPLFSPTIARHPAAVVTISDFEVSDSLASAVGGGVAIRASNLVAAGTEPRRVVIERALFASNSARRGGGTSGLPMGVLGGSWPNSGSLCSLTEIVSIHHPALPSLHSVCRTVLGGGYGFGRLGICGQRGGGQRWWCRISAVGLFESRRGDLRHIFHRQRWCDS